MAETADFSMPHANKFPGFVSMVSASDVDSSLSAILLEY
jgi:hypothetical protein